MCVCLAESCDVLQEVEEDKKRAEQEVMPLHSRKGKADDLTITINKSSNVSCFILGLNILENNRIAILFILTDIAIAILICNHFFKLFMFCIIKQSMVSPTQY